MKNEKTSKSVASLAGKILNRTKGMKGDWVLVPLTLEEFHALQVLQDSLPEAVCSVDGIEKVCASVLTQTADKKKH